MVWSFHSNALFICFCLCWVFTAERAFLWLQQAGVLSAGGEQASPCGGFSCCGARTLGCAGSEVEARGLSSRGSRALEHRRSSPWCIGSVAACHVGSSQVRDLYPWLLHWQVDSVPLSHQGSPTSWLFIYKTQKFMEVLLLKCSPYWKGNFTFHLEKENHLLCSMYIYIFHNI